jgi:hypothetical protein
VVRGHVVGQGPSPLRALHVQPVGSVRPDGLYTRTLACAETSRTGECWPVGMDASHWGIPSPYTTPETLLLSHMRLLTPSETYATLPLDPSETYAPKRGTVKMTKRHGADTA